MFLASFGDMYCLEIANEMLVLTRSKNGTPYLGCASMLFWSFIRYGKFFVSSGWSMS